MKMQFNIATILLIVLQQVNAIVSQGILMSPCPKMFQYRFDGSEWFGLLSVRNPDFGQPLHLRVTLSMRGKPTTNYLGQIELLTRGQFFSDAPVLYKIKFPKTQFPPKVLQITTNGEVICVGAADHSIFVTQIQLEHTRKFTFIPDDVPMPALTSGFELPAPPPATATTDTEDFVLPSTDIGFKTKHLPLINVEKTPMSASKKICGKIDDRVRFQFLQVMKDDMTPDTSVIDKLSPAGVLLPRTVDRDGASIPTVVADNADTMSSGGGSATIKELPSIARGAWPWLAAIYVNNLTSLAYQCGGTLISKSVVISSAHCFSMFDQRYSANEVLVFLGRHNLKNWNEEGSVAASVDDIFVHPDYDARLHSYDADIAVLLLSNEVRFNTFIRPACLWSGSTKIQYIEGEHGIVVGWGLGRINSTDALATVSTVPKIVNAPIVSNDVCFKANYKFRSLSSIRTFCAGVVAPTVHSRAKPQFGLCTGDSGAGLLIFRNNRWMLRGIVSATLPPASSSSLSSSAAPTTQFSCNANQYVVYADAAKFLDWILAFTI